MKRQEINIIGGVGAVAKLCNVTPSAVSMWFAKDINNGKIPYKHAKVIAKEFAKLGLEKSIEYIVGE